MNVKLLGCLVSIISFAFFFFGHPSVTHASHSTPYQVPSSVRNGWSHIYGSKQYSTTSGKKIIYDVYKDKFTNGGYAIVNKDFGKGTQPYLTFQGWSILFGYHNEYSYNNETYIVARKITGDSGVGTTKVYSTLKKNLNATTDLEYNNRGGGLYNPCSNSQYNKDNQKGCNMYYEDVGFNAYIPMKDLFPNRYEKASWKFYIVKDVSGHMVYTDLKVPFTFSDKSYDSGKVDLSSGVNADQLRMIGTHVTRRSYPDEPVSYVGHRYFATGVNYTMNVTNDKVSTAVWYGVKVGGSTRYAASPYWDFGGEPVNLTYYPPPKHIKDEVWTRYRNGNDYWAKPYDQVYIRFTQYDETGNKYQYLRLYGSGIDVKSLHKFGASSTYNDQFVTSSHVKINSAYRDETNPYGRVKWGVIPKVNGDSYNIEYYYEDNKYDHIGYVDTGKNLRVDGVAPTLYSDHVWGYRYQHGNDYWVRPNDQVQIRFTQHDGGSGNMYQYLRLVGSGVDVRSQHKFDESSHYNNRFITSSHVSITSADRQENTSYGRVLWTVDPKKSGDSYNIEYYLEDHVTNYRGYGDTGKNLRVDGVAPSISFSPNSSSWRKSNLGVGVKVSDSLSGVYRFRYQVQHGSTWGSYSGWIYGTSKSITLSQNGRNRIHVEAEDHVGNIKNQYSGYYYLDKTAPTVTFSPNSHSWTNSNINVAMKVRDTYSGVKRFRYQIQHGSTWGSYSGWIYGTSKSITLSQEGRSRIRVQVYDNAGNSYLSYSGYYYIDKTAPNLVSDGVTNYRYQNGNDYWVRPNDQVYVWMRQYDGLSGNRYQYLRLYGSGVDTRSQHDFTASASFNNRFMTSSHVTINSAQRQENTAYGKVNWGVVPKVSGDIYNIEYYFRDRAGNSRGYGDTGKNLRVDGVAPNVSINPNSQGWTDPNLKVSVNVSDSLSGVKRFRYQVQHGSTWGSYSGWIYGTSKTITLNQLGRNRVHVEAEDNVGNIRNQYSGYYYIDTAPIAKFHFNPSTVYEGDNLKVVNDSTDPDGNSMTAYWTITAPNGQVTHQSTWDAQINHLLSGQYQVTLNVTDSYGRTDSTSQSILAYPLTIKGYVTHTTKWQHIHQSKGDKPDIFYSGEEFDLKAIVTNHPVNNVEVNFSGVQIDGSTLSLSTNLLASSFPQFVGSIYDSSMSDPDTLLQDGTVYFLFTVHYANGVTKSDLVPVKISGNTYNAFYFHRTS